ncbi:MAG TPA: OB-fold domain-containing protein [Acidimicrobiales bacterium]|nr:OB-fold domain-containing protein [Acidimicrobiales bacterium]
MDSLTTPDGYLLPVLDDDSIGFWEATRRGMLVVQACAQCDRLRFPPRPMCPWCRSLESTWKESSGRGTIWSFVIAHPPLLPAYLQFSPYNCIVVALDDDPSIRMVGNLVASAGAPLNSVDNSELQIGTNVKVVFDKLNDEITLPRWIRA